VYVDPFGITDLAREYRLDAHEAWVLLVLTLHADWKTLVFPR